MPARRVESMNDVLHPLEEDVASAITRPRHDAALEYGVTPGTRTFERCVVSAAKAFDRGEPDLAYAEARIARAAREACKTSGKTPVALDGSACADGLTRP